MMRIAFTFDINDLYEVVTRSSRGKLRRSWDGVLARLWSLLIAVPAAAWAAYGVSHPGLYPLVIAAIGITGGVAQWYTAQAQRARVFEYLEYASGGRGPFTCEVELGPEGLVTHQFGEEIRRQWTAVEEVRDTGANVEVDLGRRGLLIVRANAFTSPSEREAFVRCAQEFARNARHS